jgi:hypothetical protein
MAALRRKVTDVQHLTAHLMAGHDAFVTSDHDDMLRKRGAIRSRTGIVVATRPRPSRWPTARLPDPTQPRGGPGSRLVAQGRPPGPSPRPPAPHRPDGRPGTGRCRRWATTGAAARPAPTGQGRASPAGCRRPRPATSSHQKAAA